MSSWVPRKVAIVGVGLLGGSIAAALRHRSPATRILGVGRQQDRLEKARHCGLLDEFSIHPERIDAELIVVCTPVDRIVTDVRAAAVAAEDAVITDVGSVKGQIVDQLSDPGSPISFVGSHPMAGSEKTGFENADPDLFAGARCIVCPHESADGDAVNQVRSFWEHLGSVVTEMPAAEHDRIVAAVSHLPHAVAAALTRVPSADDLPFAATGFADSTRIAAGDPDLWTAILTANAPAVLARLDEFEEQLLRLRSALNGDQAHIRSFLAAACEARRELNEPPAGP